MTCEVAVANRLAIALAADSAVTFSTTDGTHKTYATGANKIFQMACEAPVAVMINNGASLAGIPWELIVKVYRGGLASTKFDNLDDYWTDFLAFLNDRAAELIPIQVRHEQTGEAMANGTLEAFIDILAAKPLLKQNGADPAALAAAWNDGLADLENQLALEQLPKCIDATDLPAMQALHTPDLEKEIGNFIANRHAHLVHAIDVARLARAGTELAFKRPTRVLSFTGIVIAGFGEREYLPGFVGKQVHGFLGAKLMWTDGQSKSVDHKSTSSLIEPFAQAAMIETFTQGASPEVWNAVGKAFKTFAAQAVNDACTAAGVGPIDPATVSATVQTVSAAFTKDWVIATLNAHLGPLHRVVSSLNLVELAELAETLVLLESLKEKVTSRTQSVGGPIDVAIITKSEGLVWIKRKLYFDPQLNHRYLARVKQGN
jgi:hypothetical protein